jgi:hypothetical protein
MEMEIMLMADRSIREVLSMANSEMPLHSAFAAVLSAWMTLAIYNVGHKTAEEMLTGAMAGLASDYPGKGKKP